MYDTIILLQFDLEPLMNKLIKMILDLLLSVGKVVLVLLELNFDVSCNWIELILKLIPWRFLKEVLTDTKLKFFQWIVVSFYREDLVEAADHFLHLLVLELMS